MGLPLRIPLPVERQAVNSQMHQNLGTYIVDEEEGGSDTFTSATADWN